MLKRIIDELKKKPFSGNEIIECADNETKIIKYGDISKYNTIEDLLYPHNNVVILYETSNNYGHWTCVLLHEKNNTLEFFDPYGKFIDDQINYISKDFRESSGQGYPYLSQLFLKSPYKIECNKTQFQKMKKDVSSCGRHVSLRIILSDYPLNIYTNIMKPSQGLDSDDIATYLTAFV